MKDIQLSIVAIVLAFGFLGMWVHFLQKKRRKEEFGTFKDYLFADSPGSTGITMLAFLSAMGGLFQIGSFDQVLLEPFVTALKNGVLYSPMISAVAQAFVTGFAFDSMLNKGTK
jgi:hypothetical protein